MHERIVRFRKEASKDKIANFLEKIGSALRNDKIETSHLFHIEESVAIIPVEPLKFKFLYAKENKKLEMHIEIEWIPEDLS